MIPQRSGEMAFLSVQCAKAKFFSAAVVQQPITSIATAAAADKVKEGTSSASFGSDWENAKMPIPAAN
jgi:hypothetical protein